ncbi:glycyl-radical enzyme activating protein [Peptacetobacter hiranonis]|uniref:Glycyl-radical enzyme activating protein family protein n=1 Tax=Peptacetobacter hiranonis (strain DSM 13275 / JCM 10541 / KCTC 15199 / TO-931) TaxID=500633 RepID=B6FW15_PEPHT|nr:glycyl-radical enzyme activating protein [Peptacetobacter hiranonis]EEA86293.1 glycyl-radical enzyme activating protein family protein [Peptacetobacter hiranonis DSM 13275]QEK19911.1 4-hydroxyphenylacetate decarboxylase activating enzyme [Peptacetobacter hiranonis]
MENGITFNIQKFSIHDGPGIRTTVFFKGCPLRCEWCSNPESQIKNVQILHDQSKCSYCLSCVVTCPNGAITHEDNKIIINEDKCVGCLTCVNSCPNRALSYEGDYQTIEEIVDICMQDIDFYEESGGGVTISGGEGMSQPDFLKKLIAELKKNSVHVAIETTGYVKKETFEELARELDLLLFDVKHYDREKHYNGTKVYNDLIVENLKWAIDNGIEVLPRIPVIPDFNDSLEDAEGLAKLLVEVGAKKVQLLPFHQFGEKKYELLNRNYKYKNKKALYPEELEEYQKIFLDKGLNCFF